MSRTVRNTPRSARPTRWPVSRDELSASFVRALRKQ